MLHDFNVAMNSDVESIELVVQRQLKQHERITLVDLTECDDAVTIGNTFHKAKFTLSYLELTVHPKDNFYHSNCCTQYCCCNNPSVGICLSQTFQSPKRTATIFCTGLIFYVIFVVIQQFTLDADDGYCSISNAIYLSLETIRSLMAFVQVIFVLLAFNKHLFSQQLLEFETLYKLSNCLILIIFVASYEITKTNDAIGVDSNYFACKIYSSIKYTFYVVDISSFIVLVICIDAWNMNRIFKLCIMIIGFGGLVFYYHYYAEQYCIWGNIYKDYIIIPIINYSVSVYYTTRNAIETLLIFIFKQICVFIFNEFEFTSCCINSTCTCICHNCGQRRNEAVSISVHPRLHWKSRITTCNYTPTLTKISHDFSVSLTADQGGSNSYYRSLTDFQTNDYNYNSKSHASVMYNVIQANECDDFYHTKCCKNSCIKFMICLCKNNNKHIDKYIDHEADNRSQISMADKIGNELRHGLETHKGLYLTIYIILIIVIIGLHIAAAKYDNGLCVLIATFLATAGVLPFFLSFNVDLVKSQLYQFETVYKIYLVITFVITDMSYFFTTSRYSKSIRGENGSILIVYNILRIPLWILTIVGASSIDAWNVHFYVKLFVLTTVNIWIGTWYLYYGLSSDRTSTDYFSFTVPFFARISNAYFVQQYALMTLWIFSLKQLVLLVYFGKNLCKCFKNFSCCDTFQCGKNPDKAVGIIVHPYINWQES